MRPGALRPATAKAARSSSNELASRLSEGEKRNRKRMAEVGAVYDITPVARSPAHIMQRSHNDTDDDQPGPAPAALPWPRVYALRQFRHLLTLPLIQARATLDEWLAWASRSKLAPFIKLARTIRHNRASIEATIEWKLTNGIAESPTPPSAGCVVLPAGSSPSGGVGGGAVSSAARPGQPSVRSSNSSSS